MSLSKSVSVSVSVSVSGCPICRFSSPLQSTPSYVDQTLRQSLLSVAVNSPIEPTPRQNQLSDRTSSLSGLTLRQNQLYARNNALLELILRYFLETTFRYNQISFNQFSDRNFYLLELTPSWNPRGRANSLLEPTPC
jgi:hypothetical protein